MKKKSVAVGRRIYTVLLTPAEEGGYVVTCPALPDVVTEGDTLEEALDMAKDAIQGYLNMLRDLGEAIPKSEVSAA
jgi:predicted RNase H-like HicB family nuclease